MKSGLFCEMLFSTGFMSRSVDWTASSLVILPPCFSKTWRNTAARPSEYGLSSWMVAAVLAFSFVGGEVRDHGTLDLVVVRGPQVEGLVLALGGQRRAGVGGRDEQDALLGEDGVGHTERGARAAGPDHRKELGVGHQLGGPGLPALLGAGLVGVHQLDVVPHELAGLAVKLPVQVVDGQLHAALAVDAQAAVVAGDRQQRPDLDRLARRQGQAAELVGATVRALGPTTATAVVVRAAGGRQHERAHNGHEGHPPWPTHRHSLLLNDASRTGGFPWRR